jgi:hypothetical protein
MGASSFRLTLAQFSSALSAHEESSDQRFLQTALPAALETWAFLFFLLEFAVLNLASACRAARIHPETSPSGWGLYSVWTIALCDQIRNQGAHPHEDFKALAACAYFYGHD